MSRVRRLNLLGVLLLLFAVQAIIVYAMVRDM